MAIFFSVIQMLLLSLKKALIFNQGQSEDYWESISINYYEKWKRATYKKGRAHKHFYCYC